MTLAAIGAGAMAIVLGGYLGLRSGRASATTVSAPAAAPVPAPAPRRAPILVIAPPGPPAPATPAFVELRLDSQPAGADVVLVDRGTFSPLGTTPLAATLDPSREYDLVFTLPGREPRLEHVDLRATRSVAVALDPAHTPARRHPAAKRSPKHRRHSLS
ncbi:MAG TPA: hypothetical protein VLX92_21560 [Kofleriaceae bacterium]|nr:hypothetical protein [Kofleriaceae bacterium]